jgi:hypothetical protein
MQIKQRRLFWNAYTHFIYNLYICPRKRFNILLKSFIFFSRFMLIFIRIYLAILQIIDSHFIIIMKGDYPN